MDRGTARTSGASLNPRPDHVLGTFPWFSRTLEQNQGIDQHFLEN